MIEKVKKILELHGIQMSIGGCGCCSSPWVRFRYRGEWLLGDDEWPVGNCKFTMFPEDEDDE